MVPRLTLLIIVVLKCCNCSSNITNLITNSYGNNNNNNSESAIDFSLIDATNSENNNSNSTTSNKLINNNNRQAHLYELIESCKNKTIQKTKPLCKFFLSLCENNCSVEALDKYENEQDSSSSTSTILVTITTTTAATKLKTQYVDLSRLASAKLPLRKTFDQTQEYVFKSYDMASTYTFGFGFGLPILSIFIIIIILIYCLRKRYSNSLLHIDSQSRSSMLLPSYSFSNSNPAVLNSQLYATLLSSYCTDTTNCSTCHNESLSKPPPVYENITHYSQIDKLPTYDSFRKKSKPNIFT